MHSAVVRRVGSAFEIWTCCHCLPLVDRIDDALRKVADSGPTRTIHTRLTDRDGVRVTDSKIQEWERIAIQRARSEHGRVEVKGATYHMFVDLESAIGYANGVPTSVIRVEWTSGRAVHSHPRLASDL